MSRTKKILIISHLCLAFAYLFWLLVQPYAKDLMIQKSQLSLYQMVMEKETHFQRLPSGDQLQLIEGYAAAQVKHSPSLFQVVGKQFFVETPPFALAWLFFSLVISILLLLRIDGSAFTTWLLPLIALVYAYSQYEIPPKTNDSLFPSEEYVLTTYVQQGENTSRGERETLLLGWHRYLIREWAEELPSNDPLLLKEQLDKGLFAFNVARLKWILEGKGDEVVLAGFRRPPSPLVIIGYFIWNLSFAWIINRKEKNTSVAALSTPISSPPV